MSSSEWVTKIKDALEQGRNFHKTAAAGMDEALTSVPGLNQKMVAAAVGRNTSWVCRILQWYRAGCPTDTVFGPQSKRRRDAIAATQSERKLSLEELGQMPLAAKDGEKPMLPDVEPATEFMPGEGAATEKAWALEMQCAKFNAAVAGMTAEELCLVLRSQGNDRRRSALGGLVRDLENAVEGAELLLDQIRVTLDQLRPEPMFQEAA